MALTAEDKGHRRWLGGTAESNHADTIRREVPAMGLDRGMDFASRFGGLLALVISPAEFHHEPPRIQVIGTGRVHELAIHIDVIARAVGGDVTP
jgi:hypothetical protein